jgi:hypothetical protein
MFLVEGDSMIVVVGSEGTEASSKKLRGTHGTGGGTMFLLVGVVNAKKTSVFFTVRTPLLTEH